MMWLDSANQTWRAIYKQKCVNSREAIRYSQPARSGGGQPTHVMQLPLLRDTRVYYWQEFKVLYAEVASAPET